MTAPVPTRLSLSHLLKLLPFEYVNEEAEGQAHKFNLASPKRQTWMINSECFFELEGILEIFS